MVDILVDSNVAGGEAKGLKPSFFHIFGPWRSQILDLLGYGRPLLAQKLLGEKVVLASGGKTLDFRNPKVETLIFVIFDSN